MATDFDLLIREPDKLSPVDHHITTDRVQEDIPWIMDRLAERLFADGAILTLHFQDRQDRQEPEVLCAVGQAADLPDEEAKLMRIAKESCLLMGSRGIARDHNWHDFEKADGKGRALTLLVAKDGAVCLIATIFYQRRNLIQIFIIEQIIKRFQPVLAGYFRLWFFTRRKQREISSLRAALNLSDAAIFIMDSQGALTFHNAAGAAILEKGDALHRTRRSIAAVEVADTLKLQVAIDHATHADENTSMPVIQLRKKSGGRPLIALASPVMRPPETETDPAAILAIFDPDQDITPLLRPVCELYRLSRAETKLVELLVAGETICEAAKKMRIAEPTARSYLKQIFIKTDTNRQAELVRIMVMGVMRTAIRGFQAVS